MKTCVECGKILLGNQNFKMPSPWNYKETVYFCSDGCRARFTDRHAQEYRKVFLQMLCDPIDECLDSIIDGSNEHNLIGGEYKEILSKIEKASTFPDFPLQAYREKFLKVIGCTFDFYAENILSSGERYEFPTLSSCLQMLDDLEQQGFDTTSAFTKLYNMCMMSLRSFIDRQGFRYIGFDIYNFEPMYTALAARGIKTEELKEKVNEAQTVVKREKEKKEVWALENQRIEEENRRYSAREASIKEEEEEEEEKSYTMGIALRILVAFLIVWVIASIILRVL